LKLLFFLSLFITILSSKTIDTSFITKFEYGAMLYENPRGIGCVKCHGKGDAPVVIAKYKRKDKKSKKLIEESIIAPAIDNVSYKVFIEKMRADKTESKVMPTYFLTNDELKSLYYYIKNLNKR